MGKLPKEHYFSSEKKELVLVWNFPNLLTPKSILFAFGLGIFFALLMMLESNDFIKATWVGIGIAGAIIVWSITKQQFLNSDRLRLALALNPQELGTGDYVWAFTIPWSQVKKIHCNSAVTVTLPVTHFHFWVYPKDKVPRFISIPKLDADEYQKFFEILQWHTKHNNVDLIVL